MDAAAGATAAVLDVGSNSVLLLVARVAEDGRLRILDTALETTRLGTGLAEGGRLDPAARRRTREAVVALVQRARAAAADRVWAFGTGAMRRAADGSEFAAEVSGVAGCPLEILSGAREARLSYVGATSGLGLAGWILVADIGGLTTELTLGLRERIEAAESLALGALALTERFPLDRDDGGCALVVERARGAAVDRVLAAAHLPACARGRGARLVASGGTATALATLDLGLSSYDARRVHGHVLAVPRLEVLAARALPVRGVLDPGRAGILPAGAVVLSRLAVAVGAREVVVSDRSVRHAYLVERLRAGGVPLQADAPWH